MSSCSARSLKVVAKHCLLKCKCATRYRNLEKTFLSVRLFVCLFVYLHVCSLACLFCAFLDILENCKVHLGNGSAPKYYELAH